MHKQIKNENKDDKKKIETIMDRYRKINRNKQKKKYQRSNNMCTSKKKKKKERICIGHKKKCK